jgi:energy-coupling factor transport system ATP-binding protein
MTPAICVDGLTLAYPDAPAPVLRDLSFCIGVGERVLLLGPSGCGKSSLALTLNGLVPQSIPAQVMGEIDIQGHPVAPRRVADFAQTVAYLFQDADNQLCALTAEDEIAFALENRGLPPPEIDRRIDRALAAVALPLAFRDRRTQTLSGGEKQKVMLAAALAQEAAIYVFDEATSQLDPAATAATYRTIARLVHEQTDRTVLFVDHKLDALLPLIDRVLLLDGEGRLVADMPPRPLFHEHHAEIAAIGAWRPQAAELAEALRGAGLALEAQPLTLAEAVADLDSYVARHPTAHRLARNVVGRWIGGRQRQPVTPGGPPILRLDAVGYAPRGGPTILADISLTLHGGEILGLIGRNGAGKSTLGMVMAGLLRPSAGRVTPLLSEWPGQGGFVFQNPEHQFIAPTVKEEILASLLPKRRAYHMVAADIENRVGTVLSEAGLWARRDAHPFALSQGQKRRLSVLSMTLAQSSPLLVLDEPSYGLDARAVELLKDQVAALREPDRAIVLITHDMDLAAALCDRVAVMEAGRVVRCGRADTLFGDAGFLKSQSLAQPAACALRGWLDAVAA